MFRRKPYDTWLQWNIADACNLQCHYCIQQGIKRKNENIEEISVPALMQTLDSTGKRFLVGLSGGEPFMVPNVVVMCKALTRKHMITVITNLTLSKAIERFAEEIDPKRVKFIIATIHIEQLRKGKLLKRFIDTYHYVRQKGFDIRAHKVAWPGDLASVEQLKEEFKEAGIDIIFTPFIGDHESKNYPATYSEADCAVLGIHREDLRCFYPKGIACNAGFNAAAVLSDGDVFSCYWVRNKLGNIYDSIKFHDKLTVCPFTKCTCPLFYYDPWLYRRALKQRRLNKLKPWRLFA